MSSPFQQGADGDDGLGGPHGGAPGELPSDKSFHSRIDQSAFKNRNISWVLQQHPRTPENEREARLIAEAYETMRLWSAVCWEYSVTLYRTLYIMRQAREEAAEEEAKAAAAAAEAAEAQAPRLKADQETATPAEAAQLEAEQEAAVAAEAEAARVAAEQETAAVAAEAKAARLQAEQEAAAMAKAEAARLKAEHEAAGSPPPPAEGVTDDEAAAKLRAEAEVAAAIAAAANVAAGAVAAQLRADQEAAALRVDVQALRQRGEDCGARLSGLSAQLDGTEQRANGMLSLPPWGNIGDSTAGATEPSGVGRKEGGLNPTEVVVLRQEYEQAVAALTGLMADVDAAHGVQQQLEPVVAQRADFKEEWAAAAAGLSATMEQGQALDGRAQALGKILAQLLARCQEEEQARVRAMEAEEAMQRAEEEAAAAEAQRLAREEEDARRRAEDEVEAAEAAASASAEAEREAAAAAEADVARAQAEQEAAAAAEAEAARAKAEQEAAAAAEAEVARAQAEQEAAAAAAEAEAARLRAEQEAAEAAEAEAARLRAEQEAGAAAEAEAAQARAEQDAAAAAEAEAARAKAEQEAAAAAEAEVALAQAEQEAAAAAAEAEAARAKAEQEAAAAAEAETARLRAEQEAAAAAETEAARLRAEQEAAEAAEAESARLRAEQEAAAAAEAESARLRAEQDAAEAAEAESARLRAEQEAAEAAEAEAARLRAEQDAAETGEAEAEWLRAEQEAAEAAEAEAARPRAEQEAAAAAEAEAAWASAEQDAATAAEAESARLRAEQEAAAAAEAESARLRAEQEAAEAAEAESARLRAEQEAAAAAEAEAARLRAEQDAAEAAEAESARLRAEQEAAAAAEAEAARLRAEQGAAETGEAEAERLRAEQEAAAAAEAEAERLRVEHQALAFAQTEEAQADRAAGLSQPAGDSTATEGTTAAPGAAEESEGSGLPPPDSDTIARALARQAMAQDLQRLLASCQGCSTGLDELATQLGFMEQQAAAGVVQPPLSPAEGAAQSQVLAEGLASDAAAADGEPSGAAEAEVVAVAGIVPAEGAGLDNGVTQSAVEDAASAGMGTKAADVMAGGEAGDVSDVAAPAVDGGEGNDSAVVSGAGAANGGDSAGVDALPGVEAAATSGVGGASGDGTSATATALASVEAAGEPAAADESGDALAGGASKEEKGEDSNAAFWADGEEAKEEQEGGAEGSAVAAEAEGRDAEGDGAGGAKSRDGTEGREQGANGAAADGAAAAGAAGTAATASITFRPSADGGMPATVLEQAHVRLSSRLVELMTGVQAAQAQRERLEAAAAVHVELQDDWARAVALLEGAAQMGQALEQRAQALGRSLAAAKEQAAADAAAAAAAAASALHSQVQGLLAASQGCKAGLAELVWRMAGLHGRVAGWPQRQAEGKGAVGAEGQEQQEAAAGGYAGAQAAASGEVAPEAADGVVEGKGPEGDASAPTADAAVATGADAEAAVSALANASAADDTVAGEAAPAMGTGDDGTEGGDNVASVAVDAAAGAGKTPDASAGGTATDGAEASADGAETSNQPEGRGDIACKGEAGATEAVEGAAATDPNVGAEDGAEDDAAAAVASAAGSREGTNEAEPTATAGPESAEGTSVGGAEVGPARDHSDGQAEQGDAAAAAALPTTAADDQRPSVDAIDGSPGIAAAEAAAAATEPPSASADVGNAATNSTAASADPNSIGALRQEHSGLAAKLAALMAEVEAYQATKQRLEPEVAAHAELQEGWASAVALLVEAAQQIQALEEQSQALGVKLRRMEEEQRVQEEEASLRAAEEAAATAAAAAAEAQRAAAEEDAARRRAEEEAAVAAASAEGLRVRVQALHGGCAGFSAKLSELSAQLGALEQQAATTPLQPGGDAGSARADVPLPAEGTARAAAEAGGPQGAPAPGPSCWGPARVAALQQKREQLVSVLAGLIEDVAAMQDSQQQLEPSVEQFASLQVEWAAAISALAVASEQGQSLDGRAQALGEALAALAAKCAAEAARHRAEAEEEAARRRAEEEGAVSEAAAAEAAVAAAEAQRLAAEKEAMPRGVEEEAAAAAAAAGQANRDAEVGRLQEEEGVRALRNSCGACGTGLGELAARLASAEEQVQTLTQALRRTSASGVGGGAGADAASTAGPAAAAASAERAITELEAEHAHLVAQLAELMAGVPAALAEQQRLEPMVAEAHAEELQEEWSATVASLSAVAQQGMALGERLQALGKALARLADKTRQQAQWQGTLRGLQSHLEERTQEVDAVTLQAQIAQARHAQWHAQHRSGSDQGLGPSQLAERASVLHHDVAALTEQVNTASAKLVELHARLQGMLPQLQQPPAAPAKGSHRPHKAGAAASGTGGAAGSAQPSPVKPLAAASAAAVVVSAGLQGVAELRRQSSSLRTRQAAAAVEEQAALLTLLSAVSALQGRLAPLPDACRAMGKLATSLERQSKAVDGADQYLAELLGGTMPLLEAMARAVQEHVQAEQSGGVNGSGPASPNLGQRALVHHRMMAQLQTLMPALVAEAQAIKGRAGELQSSLSFSTANGHHDSASAASADGSACSSPSTNLHLLEEARGLHTRTELIGSLLRQVHHALGGAAGVPDAATSGRDSTAASLHATSQRGGRLSPLRRVGGSAAPSSRPTYPLPYRLEAHSPEHWAHGPPWGDPRHSTRRNNSPERTLAMSQTWGPCQGPLDSDLEAELLALLKEVKEGRQLRHPPEEEWAVALGRLQKQVDVEYNNRHGLTGYNSSRNPSPVTRGSQSSRPDNGKATAGGSVRLPSLNGSTGEGGSSNEPSPRSMQLPSPGPAPHPYRATRRRPPPSGLALPQLPGQAAGGQRGSGLRGSEGRPQDQTRLLGGRYHTPSTAAGHSRGQVPPRSAWGEKERDEGREQAVSAGHAAEAGREAEGNGVEGGHEDSDSDKSIDSVDTDILTGVAAGGVLRPDHYLQQVRMKHIYAQRAAAAAARGDATRQRFHKLLPQRNGLHTAPLFLGSSLDGALLGTLSAPGTGRLLPPGATAKAYPNIGEIRAANKHLAATLDVSTIGAAR